MLRIVETELAGNPMQIAGQIPLHVQPYELIPVLIAASVVKNRKNIHYYRNIMSLLI